MIRSFCLFGLYSGKCEALINRAHEGKIISKNENRILLKEGESTGKAHKRSPKCKVAVIPSFLALVEALSVCGLWQRALGREHLLPSRASSHSCSQRYSKNTDT